MYKTHPTPIFREVDLPPNTAALRLTPPPHSITLLLNPFHSERQFDSVFFLTQRTGAPAKSADPITDARLRLSFRLRKIKTQTRSGAFVSRNNFPFSLLKANYVLAVPHNITLQMMSMLFTHLSSALSRICIPLIKYPE